MLKRRFYKLERVDEEGSIESSSSDYGSEQGVDELEECSSGFDKGNSAQVDDDISDHAGLSSSDVYKSFDGADSIPWGESMFIFKSRSALRCKICPRVVRLDSETVMIHLKSKGHLRSKRLLKEGKLKSTLNSDGEVEEDQETHSERHSRILGFIQTGHDIANPKRKKHRKVSKKRRRK